MGNKITDMLISAIIKKGILGEARNIDVEFDIPKEDAASENTKIHIKVEHMSIRIDKGNVGA